ncbi:MAG: hypothetical protein WCJ21_07680, partial [Planctomycetota bacterium]
MAANRTNVAQSLTIALITFVMLTFMLAITTYLFYKKGADEYAAAQAASADATKSKGDLQKMQADRDKLLQILGFSPDKSVVDIETETNETFQKKFGDFKKDPKAYVGLSEWLLDATKTKDQANQTLQAQIEALKADNLAKLAEYENSKAVNAKAMSKVSEDGTKAQEQFTDAQAKFKELEDELQKKVRAANEESKRLGALIAEIAKGEPLLSLDR